MKVLVLFSCVFVVKGHRRILLYDVQRGESYHVSNNYADCLAQLKIGLNVSRIESRLDSFIDFLKENELVFETESPESFPPISTKYQSTALISNIIINYSAKVKDQTNDLVKVLDRFNAEAVLINFDEVNGIEVKEYLNFFATSTIRTIELSFKNEIVFDKIDFNKLLKIYPRIKRVYIYNSLTTGSNHIYNDCYILRYKDEYVELKKRLKQKESFFTINNRLFLESQTYNPYFNGKLYVDGNGDIFNAPETRQCFGNINNLKELADVFLSNAFQKYWKVKKDICDVCKHCEFRYMCIDNRLPVRRLVGEWHYESECDYNPYIGKWQGEEGYRSLEKCGVVSNEKEFSIDHDKTAAINQELWRD